MLEQAELTLALLCSSNPHPNLSAYAHIHGEMDYNATLFASTGLKTLIYKTPTQRKSWAQNGVVGWYVPTPSNVTNATNAMCLLLELLGTPTQYLSTPPNFAVPAPPKENDMEGALKDLTTALTHACTQTSVPSVGDRQFQAIRQLQKIFSATPSPGPPPNYPPHISRPTPYFYTLPSICSFSILPITLQPQTSTYLHNS